MQTCAGDSDSSPRLNLTSDFYVVTLTWTICFYVFLQKPATVPTMVEWQEPGVVKRSRLRQKLTDPPVTPINTPANGENSLP